MTTNLDFGSTTANMVLEPTDSDVKTKTTVPKSVVQTTTGTVWDGDGWHIYKMNTGESLYNWYTATAGTGSTSMSANVDVEGSICPLGWKLTHGGSTIAINNFRNLSQVYGLPTSNASGTSGTGQVFLGVCTFAA